MTPLLRKLLGLNWLLLATMLALAIFGVIAIYSATYMREDTIASEFWRKQANWVAVAASISWASGTSSSSIPPMTHSGAIRPLTSCWPSNP